MAEDRIPAKLRYPGPLAQYSLAWMRQLVGLQGFSLPGHAVRIPALSHWRCRVLLLQAGRNQTCRLSRAHSAST